MRKNPRLIDISLMRFGRWLVDGQAGNAPGGGALWNCVCDCGTVRRVLGADLRKGKSVSCGCASEGRLGDAARTHGGTGSRLYQTWKGMRARCLNTNGPGYGNYGGRGIAICSEWNEFASFQAWALSSGYRGDLTIERKDVDGNYEPGNCVWAGRDIQNANRRFVKKAPDGDLWWHKAQANGISVGAYRWRIFNGWPFELAATWPQGKRREKRQRDGKGHFV